MAHKGYKQSKEHREKLKHAGFQPGHARLYSDEVKNKMKGRTGYWKNKKRPDISGENHYLWNNKTPLIEQIRKCFEYRQWRSDVFQRDDWKCISCGISGCYLHAHHLKAFIEIIRKYKIETMEQAVQCMELWDINNGTTLCRECHKKIPAYSYDGKRKITFIKS